MRFLILDIRRLFSHKAMLALCVLAPLVVMLLFASVAIPMLFTGETMHFNLALYQEDNSVEVKAFIFQLVHSRALEDLVNIRQVGSVDEGLALLDHREVSVVMHIPRDVLEDIRNQKAVRVTLYGTPEHALEQELIRMTLGQSLLLVGQGQNQMEAAKAFLMSQGVELAAADVFLRDMTYEALAQYMLRRQILGETGTLSPLGEYLPVEYYLAAIFALFAAFAMLPLIHYSASDLAGSIVRRGLACGRGIGQFYLARVFSGGLFILLVLLMVFPTTYLLNLADRLIGTSYHGSLPALFLTILLAAFCLSALAAALAAWVSKIQPALWTGFFTALVMAAAGGALVPEGDLPAWVVAVGRYLPVRAAMRGLASALFTFDPAIFWPDMIKLVCALSILLPVGFWGFTRRVASR
jgi:hypothetical protein